MIDLDMHLHTNLSDGNLTVEELAKNLFVKGIKYTALTDHDTINGTFTMSDECAKYGITAISGIEMEAMYDYERCLHLHLLCYLYKDHEKLEQFCRDLAQERTEAVKDAINKLKTKNIIITLEEVKENSYINTPTINSLCDLLVARGFFTNYVDAIKEFYDAKSYLYIDYPKYSTKYMLDLIDSVGGISVLAHPKTIKYKDEKLDDLIRYLKDNGLSGIETYYRSNTEIMTIRTEILASKYDLIETVGSDFHYEKAGFSFGVPNVPKDKVLYLKDKFYK